MKEVPMAYVKANQSGIVLIVIAAFIWQQPWLIAGLWAVQLLGLLLGGKWNLFVRIAKPFLRIEGRPTQAEELQRFNNTLAVLFLTLSSLAFLLGLSVAGWIIAIMLLCAAGAALLGYCIGCTIYFQYKQYFARRR